MFGISFSELLFIFLVALVVLGPKQLAAILNSAIKYFYLFKANWRNLKRELYINSGAIELSAIKANLANNYYEIHSNFNNNQQQHMYFEKDFSSEEDYYYQPELNFGEQPELFD